MQQPSMHRLMSVFVVTALALALSSTAGNGYEAIAREMAIQRTPAAELHKDIMIAEARFDEAQRPSLPRGLQIVLPPTGIQLTPTRALT